MSNLMFQRFSSADLYGHFYSNNPWTDKDLNQPPSYALVAHHPTQVWQFSEWGSARLDHSLAQLKTI